jgi:hypothetical protein
MGTTLSTDLVVPEILAEAIQAEFAGMNLLLGSGAAVISNTLPGTVKGGKEVTVPYFEALGEMEDVPEGDALTPATLTMTDEKAVVQHSGKAVELTYWAQLAAEYADPYAEVARQFRVLTERRVDKALMDAAMASLPLEYTLDVYNSGTPKTLGYDVIVDARTKWGDEQEGIVLLGVHSKVYGDLLKEKGVDYQPLLSFASDAQIARAAGIAVKVSDKNAKSGDTPPKYTSMIVKRAALAFWYQGVPRVRVGFDPLADTDVIAIHMYWAAHRYKRVSGGTKPGVIKIITN